MEPPRFGVDPDRIVVGLTAVFGGMTALLLLLSVVLLEPALLVVAIPVGCAAFVFWYQASGSFAARVGRRRPGAGAGRDGGPTAGGDPRASGGFGAGPREGFRGHRGRRARQRWERRRSRERRTRAGPGAGPSELSRAEARRRLGLDADGDADQRDVQRAYHEKVKEVHPDRGGDEEEFKAVTKAYERLSERG